MVGRLEFLTAKVLGLVTLEFEKNGRMRGKEWLGNVPRVKKMKRKIKKMLNKEIKITEEKEENTHIWRNFKRRINIKLWS
jgi:hypothetical protein